MQLIEQGALKEAERYCEDAVRSLYASGSREGCGSSILVIHVQDGAMNDKQSAIIM